MLMSAFFLTKGIWLRSMTQVFCSLKPVLHHETVFSWRKSSIRHSVTSILQDKNTAVIKPQIVLKDPFSQFIDNKLVLSCDEKGC